MLNFFKMQFQGNDYIYIDFNEQKRADVDYALLSKKLSDRRFGIGADGLVLIKEDKESDAQMKMFNADGSIGKMCGSALSCVVSYLSKIKGKNFITVSTDSGRRSGEVLKNGETRVLIGKPKFLDKKEVDGKLFFNINLGNNHFVTFLEKIPQDISIIGKKIENDFDVNIEFINILNKNNINMRVWERGSGETHFCGTGVCAGAFASIISKKCESSITLKVLGGEVQIEFDGENIHLLGKSKTTFIGEIDLKNYEDF